MILAPESGLPYRAWSAIQQVDVKLFLW